MDLKYLTVLTWSSAKEKGGEDEWRDFGTLHVPAVASSSTTMSAHE